MAELNRCTLAHWMWATPRVSITLTASQTNSSAVICCASWMVPGMTEEDADARPESDCSEAPPGQMRRPNPGPLPDEATNLRVVTRFKTPSDTAVLTVSQGGTLLGKLNLNGCAVAVWNFTVYR